MATVEKIRKDIEKTKEKISAQQKRLRELEAQLTEEENLEIVRMVKAVRMDNRELTAFLRAYASGMIRPLARVFDCTTFYGAENSATGFAYKKHHLFSHYGPYSDSRRRHARNWLRDNLPAGSYKVIINTKRAIFGPHEGPYED